MRARLPAILGGLLTGGEEGNSVVEYALLLALITVVGLGALAVLGQSVSNFCGWLAGTL